MAKPAIEEFEDLLQSGRPDAALAYWLARMELRDMREQGRGAFIAVIRHGADGLLGEMISHAKNFTDAGFGTLLDYAITNIKPGCVGKLLAMRPGALRDLDGLHPSLLLCYNTRAQASELTSMSNVHVRAMARRNKKEAGQCIKLLIEAGALELLSPDDGNTALAWALQKDATKYAVFLVQKGADLHARMANNKTVGQIYTSSIPPDAEPNVHHANCETYKHLMQYVSKKQEEVRKYLQDNPPEKLLQGYADMPLLRSAVHCTLSNDRGDILLNPHYWEQHGGARGAAVFAEGLREQFPDYLAYMRGRLDCSAMVREATLAREDSVTVEYVRGGAHATLREREA